LITLADALRIVDARPAHAELVLTGRNAPPELLALADLVTEMRLVKHYFYEGIPARPGVEF
jgi:cob(I)alamin adenosyltransferase